MARGMLVIDVAHPPIPPGRIEERLVDALAEVRNSPLLRVVKVVHGYGSSGRGGSTRETVRNWAFRHRTLLRSIVEGERYAAMDPATEAMVKEADIQGDPDLDARNPGITLLWVK
jgi:hypothetical protein